MRTTYTFKPITSAVLGAFLLTPLAAISATPAAATSMDKPVAAAPAKEHAAYSERAHNQAWGSEKDQLETALKAVSSRANYAKALQDRGYTITAINEDKPEYLEYEVVKAGNSYEVQLNFDKGASKATKVDVTTNLWRAKSTKAAMRGDKVPMATKVLPANAAFSDRAHMKGWTDEKASLEKALGAGSDRASYEAKLKQLGYQITSVNDAEKNYLEYEVVKGDNSYEVQIDLDNAVGKKVDVTTNMWESSATEKALEHGN